MRQKRNPSRFIEVNDVEEEEEQPCKSSLDGGDDDSDEEVDDDESEEVEVDNEEEEVEDDDEEEVEEDEEEVEEDEDDDLNQVEVKEDFSSKESILKLLQPFGKDKLVGILKEAALKNSALLSRLSSTSKSDHAYRKIFVHCLAADATSKEVAAAFSPFGHIEDCNVIVDPVTGRCKGYGFVLFKSRAAATRALKDPLKRIGSRTTNCHLASSGPQASGGKASAVSSGRKIIVNNVSDKVIPEGPLPSSLRANGLTPSYTSAATLMGQNLGQGPTTWMGQNGGSGHFNPTAGLYPALSIGSGDTRAQPYGIVSANRGSGLGVNSISHSVISKYETMSALHGMGAYQNSTSTATLKPQSRVDFSGTSRVPPFFGH